MAKKPKDKPRRQKLKVFRTPIGFHDAFVAAPSRKAALEAWGADSNIFAQGIAEEVTDPGLIEEALARPGEVIRRLRGSAEEHAAALARTERPMPKQGGSAPSRAEPPLSGVRERGRKPKRPPKPSRADLDSAEEALEKAEKKQRKAMRKVEERMQALERERRDLQRRQERELDELTEERDRARSAYDRAMRAWKG